MNVLPTIQQYLEDFIGLFYPNLCLSCEAGLKEGEKTICLSCRYLLPKTDFHMDKDNPVEKLFWGKVPIEHAAAYYYFSKDSKVQRLIHHLKYNGRQEVGELLGKWYGADLLKSPYYQKIDYILPVPLHKDREKKRGYNQADCIAKGLSEGMSVPWTRELLIRSEYTSTQTKKSRIERWQNVSEIFQTPSPEKLEGKHVLLVDDVVTTGSTLEACAIALKEVEGVKVSIVTLAVAYD